MKQYQGAFHKEDKRESIEHLKQYQGEINSLYEKSENYVKILNENEDICKEALNYISLFKEIKTIREDDIAKRKHICKAHKKQFEHAQQDFITQWDAKIVEKEQKLQEHKDMKALQKQKRKIKLDDIAKAKEGKNNIEAQMHRYTTTVGILQKELSSYQIEMQFVAKTLLVKTFLRDIQAEDNHPFSTASQYEAQSDPSHAPVPKIDRVLQPIASLHLEKPPASHTPPRAIDHLTQQVAELQLDAPLTQKEQQIIQQTINEVGKTVARMLRLHITKQARSMTAQDSESLNHFTKEIADGVKKQLEDQVSKNRQFAKEPIDSEITSTYLQHIKEFIHTTIAQGLKQWQETSSPSQHIIASESNTVSQSPYSTASESDAAFLDPYSIAHTHDDLPIKKLRGTQNLATIPEEQPLIRHIKEEKPTWRKKMLFLQQQKLDDLYLLAQEYSLHKQMQEALHKPASSDML